MQRAKGSHLFGKVAVQLGLLGRDDVKACVEEQRASGGRTLGQVAVDLGLLDEDQARRVAIVQAFLEARDEDRRFGQVAVDNAFVTRDQLQDALALQKKEFKEDGSMRRIGEIFLQLNYLTGEQRDAVLKAQQRLCAEQD